MHSRTLLFPIITVVGLSLGSSGALQAAGDHENGHGFSFGKPVDAGEADRTVEIDATDSMDFQPSDIVVRTGEVVRFVVTNTGTLHHSFTLGSKSWHRDHEQQMQGLSPEDIVTHMRSEPNGAVVPPGETRTLTWKFLEPGVVEIGCHVPGHYPAGMKGKVDVS